MFNRVSLPFCIFRKVEASMVRFISARTREKNARAKCTAAFHLGGNTATVRLEGSSTSREELSSSVAKNQSHTRAMSSGPNVLDKHVRCCCGVDCLGSASDHGVYALPLVGCRIRFGGPQRRQRAEDVVGPRCHAIRGVAENVEDGARVHLGRMCEGI